MTRCIFFTLLWFFLSLGSIKNVFAEGSSCPLSNSLSPEAQIIQKASLRSHQGIPSNNLPQEILSLTQAIQGHFRNENINWGHHPENPSKMIVRPYGKHPLNQLALYVQKKYQTTTVVDPKIYLEKSFISYVIYFFHSRNSEFTPSLKQLIHVGDFFNDSTFVHEEQHLISQYLVKQKKAFYRLGSVSTEASNSDTNISSSTYSHYFRIDELQAFSAQTLSVLKRIKAQKQMTQDDLKELVKIRHHLNIISHQIYNLRPLIYETPPQDLKIKIFKNNWASKIAKIYTQDINNQAITISFLIPKSMYNQSPFSLKESLQLMLSQAYTINDKVQKLQLQLSDFILKNKKSKEKTTSLISDFESLIYEINNH